MLRDVKGTLPARFVHAALCLLLLHQLAMLALRLEFSPAILGAALAPGTAADQSVPDGVFEAGGLIRKHALREFSLGPALASDPLFLQRIVEYGYPARLQPGASPTFVGVNEIGPSCALVDRTALIALCAVP